MSKSIKLTIWIIVAILLPLIMKLMVDKFGSIGLFPMLAIAFLMGLSLFPHVLKDDENGS